MVQLDLKKKYRMYKAIYLGNGDYFLLVGLQWTNRKVGKIVTLYQREFFKKNPRLCAFCTQSVNEGLRKWRFREKNKKNDIDRQRFKPSTSGVQGRPLSFIRAIYFCWWPNQDTFTFAG